MSLAQFEFVTIINEEFHKLKQLNPNFSLRSFARKLEMHPATLSSILKGRRGVPKTKALMLVEKLDLPRAKRNQFLRSAQMFSAYNADFKDFMDQSGLLLDEKNLLHRKIIQEWEYCAILSLLEIEGQWTREKIAAHFDFAINKTDEFLADLVKAEFVTTSGRYFELPKIQNTQTTQDIPSETIRNCHRNEMTLALKGLKDLPVDQVDYSSHTMAIDRRNLPKAKALIKNFRHELAELLESGQKSDVYMLCVQLLPLSKVEQSL